MNKFLSLSLLGLAMTSMQMLASGTPANASTLFRTVLSGKNEIAGTAPDGPFSPNPNNSTATGVVDLILNDDETQIDYRFQLSGLNLSAVQFAVEDDPRVFTNEELQNTYCPNIPLADCNVVSRLHFHQGSANVNGLVVFAPADLTLGHYDDQDDIEVNVAAGTVSGIWKSTDLEAPLTPELVNALKTGNFYVNVHTVRFPNGEIRGQVGRVPEPGTLIGLAVAGSAGFLLRRHKHDT